MNGQLSKQYTCDGTKVSPPISWQGAPPGTRSFAVLMWHIPPGGEDRHYYWVLYNIPATVSSLSESSKGVGVLGGNFANKSSVGYGPPCSQGSGVKTYILTLYALAVEKLSDLPSTDAASTDHNALVNAVAGKTIAVAQITGTYERT